ncbi:hypothetical protein CIPAW_15G069900 [Carya illinoinensis]|uniref:Uncharacterized protein n=1 Tax=Carya illinoinensis TaxID=32201 RepID=A0A8T1N4W5_CARIL|nr:hypothetical protein CIPAW_15G069900 [Carya illinoinensis]
MQDFDLLGFGCCPRAGGFGSGFTLNVGLVGFMTMGAEMFFSQHSSCSIRVFFRRFLWHCYLILAWWVSLCRSIGFHL